jgi:hypothetical protein
LGDFAQLLGVFGQLSDDLVPQETFEAVLEIVGGQSPEGRLIAGHLDLKEQKTGSDQGCQIFLVHYLKIDHLVTLPVPLHVRVQLYVPTTDHITIKIEFLSNWDPGLTDFSWYMIPKPEKCTK